MSIGTELIAIFILILLNGFFAMAEMAVVSSRKARLRQRAEEGSKRFALVLKTAEHPTRFLSTIQIAITLIGTLSGTLGGATIAESFTREFLKVPALAPYAQVLSILIVVVLITFLSAVFGELIPKRIALVNPEHISAAVIIPVRVVSSIFHPFVILFSAVTDLVLRILGLRDRKSPSVTEDEIHILMQQGAEEGVFERSERDMVQSVLELGSQRVGAYMTHRTEVVAIEESMPQAEIISLIMAHPQYSQFPVCRGGMDRVIGIVVAKQVLIDYQLRGDLRLRALMLKPVFLPKSMESLKAVEVLRTTPAKAAIVMDEYGGVEGLVSLSDITDAVFGVITGVFNRKNEEPSIRKQAEGVWLVDGLVEVDDFLDAMKIPGAVPVRKFHTVAGLYLEICGTLPSVGHSLNWEGLHMTVSRMEGRRIAQLTVSTVKPSAQENPAVTEA